LQIFYASIFYPFANFRQLANNDSSLQQAPSNARIEHEVAATCEKIVKHFYNISVRDICTNNNMKKS